MGRRSERLVAGLTAIALVPVWIFRYFPTQDGPSHLYNAFVLARLGSGVVVPRFFVLNLRPFPNWTTSLVMAPLTLVLPALVVQQIVISLCVIAIPAATLYLQKSFKESSDDTALFGVVLAYSYLLMMGFFNFILGAALFAFTLGFWRRHPARIALIYLLLLAAYVTHGFAFAATVVAIATLAIIEKRWRALIFLTPALAVLAVQAFERMRAEREFRSITWHLRQLWDFEPVVFFTDAHAWLGRVVFILICVAIALTRRWRPIIVVTLVLFAGFWLSPWGYGSGGWALGGWINDRFLFLAALTLPAWVEVPRVRVLFPIMLILVLVHIGLTASDVARMSRRIEPIAGIRTLIRPHATLKSLGDPIPLTERPREQGSPALHVASYLALQPDVVDLDDYEARLPDFPISFRKDLPQRPPDYLLVWRTARVRNVAGYSVIFTSPDVRLFARAGN